MTQAARKFLFVLLPIFILLAGCNEPIRATPSTTFDLPQSSTGILGGNPQRTGFYPNGGSPQLGGILWEYHPDSGDLQEPVVANGMVYVMISDFTDSALNQGIHQLDAETGKFISTYSAYRGSTPTVVSDTVYFSDQHGFYAIDTSSPTAQRIFATSNEIAGYSPLVLEGSAYVGDYNGPFFAVDGTTGKQEWKFAGGSGFNSLAAGYAGMIYVNGGIEPLIMGGTDAFGQNNLFALDAQTGQQVWKFEPPDTRQKALTDPITMDGAVYCASGSDFHEPTLVYALDSKSGALQWRYQPNGELRDPGISLAADAGQVFAAISSGDTDPYNYSDVHSGGSLVALDSLTGAVHWTFKAEQGLRHPAISSGVVYVVGYDKKQSVIYGIDAQTGNMQRKFQYDGAITSSLAIQDGVIYFTTNADTLVAVK